MTLHEFARLEQARLLAAVIGECDPRDAVAVMSAALEDMGAGLPEPAWQHVREDAALWAEIATPHELEAYTVAGLRRLGQTPLGIASRKRLLVRLWSSLPPQDRTAFLARVDPNGHFRGKDAA